MSERVGKALMIINTEAVKRFFGLDDNKEDVTQPFEKIKKNFIEFAHSRDYAPTDADLLWLDTNLNELPKQQESGGIKREAFNTLFTQFSIQFLSNKQSDGGTNQEEEIKDIRYFFNLDKTKLSEQSWQELQKNFIRYAQSKKNYNPTEADLTWA